MNADAILTVSAAVVALTQFAKWSGVPTRWAPLMVMALAAVGVALWGASQPLFARAHIWQYFAGWVAVTMSAAGVYGFTRAAGEFTIRRGTEG